MREINYRQAIFISGEFHSWHYWGYIGGRGFEAPITSFQGRTDVETKPSQEFTGPHDKNGKEIYEGDIIKNANGIYLEIYWDTEETQFRQRVCNRINVEKLGYLWEQCPTNLPLRYNIKEIIGNIYENPELLKEGA